MFFFLEKRPNFTKSRGLLFISFLQSKKDQSQETPTT